MPVRGLNAFTRDLSAFGAGIEEEVNAVKRKAALRVLTGVTLATPVDTGRAMGNWTVSIGAPDSSVSENRDRSGGTTIAKGSAVISRALPKDTIFITNNLPYIVSLNDGSSSQAPAKFVERAVQAGVESIRR